MLDERHTQDGSSTPGSTGSGYGSPNGPTGYMSVWDYIEKHHKKSTLFQNFMYSPMDQEAVCIISSELYYTNIIF